MYEVEADNIGIVPARPRIFMVVSAAASSVTTTTSYQTIRDMPTTNWMVNSRNYAVSHPSDTLHIDVRFSGLSLAYELLDALALQHLAHIDVAVRVYRHAVRGVEEAGGLAVLVAPAGEQVALAVYDADAVL